MDDLKHKDSVGGKPSKWLVDAIQCCVHIVPYIIKYVTEYEPLGSTEWWLNFHVSTI